MVYTEENYKKAKPTDEFEFICPVCRKIFYKTKRSISKNNKKTPKYCSKECYKIGKTKKMIIVKCEECGKEYEIESCVYNRKIKEKSNFFCCKSCAAKYNNKKYPKRIKIWIYALFVEE